MYLLYTVSLKRVLILDGASPIVCYREYPLPLGSARVRGEDTCDDDEMQWGGGGGEGVIFH